MLVTTSLQNRIFDLLDFVIFRTEGLKGFNSIKNELNNAIRFKFAVTNNFRSQKKSQEGKSFVGNFKTKKSKHWC